MSGFLGELGKKLAERWLTLLVLPGLLYLAVAAAAHTMGHSHALDVVFLSGRLTAWAKTPAATALGGQVVLLAGILAAAAAAGLVARAAGSAVDCLVLAPGWHTWTRPARAVIAWQVRRRQRAWDDAHATYHRLFDQAAQARRRGRPVPDPAPRHAAHRARDRISAERPDRPTWSGDRLHAVAVRLERDLHLELPGLWPHLWLTLPDRASGQVSTARQDLARATTLAGWAILYLPLTSWWWPAAPLSLAIGLIAWRRTRAAADTYAMLLEAAIRLYLTDLAQQVNLPHTGPATGDLGDTLTHLFHSPPPAPGVEPAADPGETSAARTTPGER